jgi:phosphatidate cytidylyltransferase
MSNLLLRIISAIIGVALVISGIVFSPWTFGAIFLIILAFTLHEFYGLVQSSGNTPFRIWGSFFSVCLFVSVYLVCMSYLDVKYFWMLPPLLVICFLFALYKHKTRHPIISLGLTLLGLVYIAFPLSLVNVIAFKDGEYSYVLVIGVLLAQWANDTGAYLVGKTMGKTKLFVSISPNKTWEGTIGGGLISIGVLYIYSLYFTEISTIEWIGLAIIVSIFGSYGDLIESLFKRQLAIKDSGTFIPGHGGFLDRFDGLLFALPFVTAYLMVIT